MKTKWIQTLYFLLLILAVNVCLKIYSNKIITKDILINHYRENYTEENANTQIEYLNKQHLVSWVRSPIMVILEAGIIFLILSSSLAVSGISLKRLSLFNAVLVSENVFAIQKMVKLMVFDLKGDFSLTQFREYSIFSLASVLQNHTENIVMNFALNQFNGYHILFISSVFLITKNSAENKSKLFASLGIGYSVALLIWMLFGVFMIMLVS